MSEPGMVSGEVQQVQAALQLFEQGREQIGRIIAGQQELVEQALLTLLCGGHALVEGVPGVAKTLAVKTLARFLSAHVSPRAGHAGHDARGHPWHDGLFAQDERVFASQRAGVYAVSSGRRDQPHASAHAGGAARKHGGAAGDDGWRGPRP